MSRRHVLAVLVLLTPGAARADPAIMSTGPHRAHVRHAPEPLPHGVMVPDRQIDPGMKVMAPRMPPQSTPVLHPPSTAPGGTVVVPK